MRNKMSNKKKFNSHPPYKNVTNNLSWSTEMLCFYISSWHIFYKIFIRKISINNEM